MNASESERTIQRALISVSDKTGLLDFATRLAGFDVEILSTGGTARALVAGKVSVTDVSEFTGFSEMLDGRVKTLHPRIHGGILFLRDNPDHVAAMEARGFLPIDLVVVNLYPFRETVAKPGVELPEAIEQIDIGGPSMLRSAAKNHAWVTVVCDPGRYAEVLAEMERLRGATSLDLRRKLAREVFNTTATYDGAIRDYLQRICPEEAGLAGGELPERIELSLRKTADLRYGENPHQRGALYAGPGGGFEQAFRRRHGKELSHNNVLDLTAAVALVGEFAGEDQAAVVIIKHSNPCGVGLGSSLVSAWHKALACDSRSASGGIVAVNRPLEDDLAEALDSHFTEMVIAPEFHPRALERLRKKKNRILVQCPTGGEALPGATEFRSVPGGVLVQDLDREDLDPDKLRVVTRRPPAEDEMAALRFSWRVAKHVKSNAIVFASADRTLGVGAGQMSRVDATRLAVTKAAQAGLDLQGSVVASDAFFPFPDGLLAAADAGATAAIQPGGSRRDPEVIAAADERGMAMLFTSMRHFRH